MLPAVPDHEVFALEVSDAIVGDRLEQPDIAANDRVLADPGVPSENCRVSVDRDAVTHVRMPLARPLTGLPLASISNDFAH